jgi:hypothetical protein
VTLLLWSNREIGEGWRDGRERLEMLEMHADMVEMRGESMDALTSRDSQRTQVHRIDAAFRSPVQ